MLRNFQTSLPVLVIIHSLQLQILRVCFASRRYTLSILQNMVLVPEVSDSTKDDWGEWQYSTNFQQIFQISICKMPKSKYYQVKVTVRRFHMNGNNIGLSPQILQRTALLNSVFHAGYQRVSGAKSSFDGYRHKAVLLLAAVYLSLNLMCIMRMMLLVLS